MNEGEELKEAHEIRVSDHPDDVQEQEASPGAIEESFQRDSSTPTGRKAVAPLVVEVYAKAVAQTNTFSFSPEILGPFITSLAGRILQKRSAPSERTESALLQTLETAFLGDQIPAPLTSEVLLTAIKALKTVREQDRARQLITKIEEQQKPISMDPSFPTDMGDALTMALGDRISRSDSAAGIANLLADVGPACTRSETTFRDTLAEITRSLTTGMNEVAMARIIFFFSNKSIDGRDDGGLSSALLGSILPGRDPDGPDRPGWNLSVVFQVISRDYATKLDWTAVALKWDFYDFMIRDTEQFRTLLQLYNAGAQRYPPLAALTYQWQHTAGQCSLFEAMLLVPPSVYMCELNDAELADASTVPEGQASAPNPRCWASAAVLQRLLYLSDLPALARRVRDLFVKGLLGCPEVLLCALVRLQLNVANAAAQGNNVVNAGMQMKGELMRELIPLFFKPNSSHRVQNGPAALRRLWAISPNTVTAACIEAWRSTVSDPPHVRLATIVHIISIVRLLPTPETVIASLLNGSKDPEFSIAVSFVMADREILQLKAWLSERISAAGAAFVAALIGYLAKTYPTAAHRAPGDASPLVSLENMAVSLQVLYSLDSTLLSQPMSTGGESGTGSNLTVAEGVKSVAEACATAYPSIRAVISQSLNALSRESLNSGSQSPSEDDIDEMANSYFQKIYTSEQSIGEVVEMLKRFKTSGDSRENEIFACMIRNLFDEYRFFSKYPEKELRITGILFGTLIKEQLVNSITLGIALRYVLEALRRPPSPPGATTSSSGKMFRFGMFALEQFKERLHEWPQYCSHIVQIPHLKEGYADLVAEIEQAMAESQNRGAGTAQHGQSADTASTTSDRSRSGAMAAPVSVPSGASSVQSGRSMSSTLELSAAEAAPAEKETRIPVFGPKLGRAVNDNLDAEIQHEAPTDAVLDRVQFLINNVSPSNVEQKSQELKEILEPKYFDWLGHYLVVKRISAQPNFHALYLAFLDHLGDYGKGLIESILSSAYLNIGKLLRSPKITTSTSERSLLKNLGSWLGQITIARSRPILQIMLDCKELLFQGYENGKLIAVTPFVAKILEGAKNSTVFRPPNPWVMGLLGVFRALYLVDDLKMNIKFEVEVLCKNLSIKLEDIPPRTQDLTKRISPIKERNPDFNMKTSMVVQNASQNSGANSSAGSSRSPTPMSSPDVKPGASGAMVHSVSSGDVPRTPSAVAAGAAPQKTAGSQDPHETVIPNLGAYVTINPSLTQLIQNSPGTIATKLNSETLQRCVPLAVDRAIREIIQPVVERSVTIACITTKEIATKDFATEGNEKKMREAAQLMVANLAGSLALVTCRDPLRSSVSTHMRQLLTSGAGGADKLNDQEQSTIEQCVAICAADNMELGCMLIEKAATEKAVRDVEDSLADAFAARRKHREHTGGQPYYDMAVLGSGNQRFPGALPEPLRPKPGGLRSDELRVYEAFQRVPRQQGSGTQDGAGLPSGRPSENPNESVLQQLNVEGLNTIASKLDSSISSLLSSAGSRAPEVTLSMLPAEHDVRKLIAAVTQCVPRNLTQSEKETVLMFSQNVFKRLYELNLSEPLRLEALVALLEKINLSCPQLSKDLGTWATYAPTETEAQRKLHRTVLLLLVRSNLIPKPELDNFLSSNAENGRNPVWAEFSLLFIRTAFLERIAVSGDFPKLMNLMTIIAEGRSQASPQLSQTLRKPILRMLEEVRGSSGGVEVRQRVASVSEVRPSVSSIDGVSSLSTTSLATYSSGTKKASESLARCASKDPGNAKQQVTFLLDSWIRVHQEALSNEKTLGQYLLLLQQGGVGKSDEQTERFFRLSIQIVVEAVLKTSNGGSSTGNALNYTVIDIYSKLVPLLIKHMNDGGTAEQLTTQRESLLNKVLGVVVRCIMWDFEKNKSEPGKPWDQRPWFRLFLNLVVDLSSPDPVFDQFKSRILGVFGGAFHLLQPLVVPGFAFAWLELVSHRSFLPTLLLLEEQKGWNLANQLVVDLFLFLEPSLRKVELPPAVKKLYEGTLRVLLVLLHDFPSFLAVFHLSLCNVIPESCVQLRNIILSAVPRGMSLPDPFTPNLKIDSLPEISKNPVILSNVVGPLEELRPELDSYLKGDRGDFISVVLQRLRRTGTMSVDIPRVNALVLYVGMQGIKRLQSSQIPQPLAKTPELEIFQKLMELDDHGRYISLNAVANQLRFPSSHTHYFSCVMLFLFSESKNVAVKEQVTRVLLERLILHRPHPWGLLITFIELIKNQRYQFWSHPFTRCATEIEKVFESVARSCMTPGTQRSTLVGGDNVQ